MRRPPNGHHRNHRGGGSSRSHHHHRMEENQVSAFSEAVRLILEARGHTLTDEDMAALEGVAPPPPPSAASTPTAPAMTCACCDQAKPGQPSAVPGCDCE